MPDLPFVAGGGTQLVVPINEAVVLSLDAKEDKNKKGQPNGYAPLDANSKVPVANLPDSAALDAEVATQISAHNSSATSVHGIANTANLVLTDDARLTNARTPTAHTHGNITNAGAIGSTENLPLITTTSGVVTTGAFGNTANSFCQGNDSRLSDARTPTAHTHAISDVTNLQTELNNKQASGTYATLVGGKVPSEQLPPTGNTIAVDSNIAAAVAASEIGDLIFVKRGSYTITSTISLNGKGDIQFETGTIVNVAGGITAFSTSENKTIIGDAFVLSDTAKLVAVSGGTLRFEFSNISSTSTGTLFTVTAGTIDTSFASIVATSARAFELTGTGSMRIRRSHSVSCRQFLYANTTGGATIDLWTVVGNSPDTVIYIDNIVGLSYRGVNCNASAGQNSYAAGYQGAENWTTTNLGAANFVLTPTSAQINSTDPGSYGYALNNTTAQITSPSRYSFSSKLKWNASRGPETWQGPAGLTWRGHAGLTLSNSSNLGDLGGSFLVIGLMPVLDDTWARPFIDFKANVNTGFFGIVYTYSTWSGFTTTLNDNGAIRLQNQPTPAVITINKIGRDLLRVVINTPMDGDRIINIKFTTQETIDAFASFNRFGYAAYRSDWTFSDQVIEGNLAPTIFFNYPQSTAGGGPISEINPVLRNIRVNTANPRTPATILTTNAQRYFYLDNVKIASWDNRLSIDSLTTATPVVAYDVYSNRPAGSNIAMIGDYRTISTIF